LFTKSRVYHFFVSDFQCCTFDQHAGSQLAHEFHQSTDVETRRRGRRLRSALASSLVVRRTRLSTIGHRAFPVAADRLWNTLPQNVTSAPSLEWFLGNVRRPSSSIVLSTNPLYSPRSDFVISDIMIDFLLTYLLRPSSFLQLCKYVSQF